ncbi:CD276 antigen-like isoform X2 [Sebastes umbrosus]|uniref:CD276 antigen-like isoform X2 n=1 Tax=Sebastes umbrosus TaxID=72105 RepID=UPI00189D1E27|nr:CD276 antigen-like isoform X2 [Sebastes umbrosus]
MSGVVRLQFSSLELLSLCFCLLSAGTTRGDQHDVVKVFAAEGSDVILPCSPSTKENIQSVLFDWRKVAQKDEDRKEVFLYDAGVHYNNGRSGQSEQFKGRVSHFPDQLKNGNASITITNTKMTDSGNYTCDFPRLQPRQIFYVELVVTATPKPSVTILDATETRALLQCDVRGASLKPKVEWQDSAGNILPAEEPQVSERGGSYDIILQTTVTKTDRYRCVVTQETISHQVSAETFVHISAATPKPSVTVLDATETWTLLQCDVRGASLKPKVEWQDSDGNILPAEEPQVSARGGSYDIILQTTVTKTDRYRCVVTQETISHQVSAETFVHISEKVREDSCRKEINGLCILGVLLSGAVIIVAGLALPEARKFITIRCNKGSREQTESSYDDNPETPLKQLPVNESAIVIESERESERESEDLRGFLVSYGTSISL